MKNEKKVIKTAFIGGKQIVIGAVWRWGPLFSS